MADKVLVTGGSGFLGAHCIIQALNAGYEVRTTIRSPEREAEVRAMVTAAGIEAGERLTFGVADLTRDDGWAHAVAGCAFVLHVASPFPQGEPAHEDELIVPAREGALRVLTAARDAGVRRTILTSSFAAVGYGYPEKDRRFTETDWTRVDAPIAPYIKSKAVAERAAWDFMTREGGAMEFTVLNPVGIFGPAPGPNLSGSIAIIRQMLSGGMKALPNIAFGVVDVRDVAALHILAMTHPAASGQRFIATAGTMSLREVAATLKAHLGADAAKVSTRPVADWIVRLAAVFDPKVRGAVRDLSVVRRADSAKAERLLGWTPKPKEDAILASGRSLIGLGLV